MGKIIKLVTPLSLISGWLSVKHGFPYQSWMSNYEKFDGKPWLVFERSNLFFTIFHNINYQLWKLHEIFPFFNVCNDSINVSHQNYELQTFYHLSLLESMNGIWLHLFVKPGIWTHKMKPISPSKFCHFFVCFFVFFLEFLILFTQKKKKNDCCICSVCVCSQKIQTNKRWVIVACNLCAWKKKKDRNSGLLCACAFSKYKQTLAKIKHKPKTGPHQSESTKKRANKKKTTTTSNLCKIKKK